MAGSLAVTLADGAGFHVAWIAPTYANSRPLWRAAEMAVSQAPEVLVRRAEREILFPSGGRIGIYTADNDTSIRGEAFDLVIVDEAAQVRGETWTDVIMPTLADRDGRAMLISTPKGRNWFWQEFGRGAGDGKHQASFHAPTTANPIPAIQRAALLARERVSDRTYRQEWLAEFVEDGAGVFRGVRRAATAEPQDGAILGHYYTIGVDWGRVDDATVFSVLDLTTKAQAALDRMTDTDYHLQLSRLTALWERFGRPPILAEQNSMGGPLVEFIQRQGLPVEPFVTTNATKAEIIDALALAFEREQIRILPDPAQLVELEAYESTRLPSGLIRYSAPDGMHDDTVMALALALAADRGVLEPGELAALNNVRPAAGGDRLSQPHYRREHVSRKGWRG